MTTPEHFLEDNPKMAEKSYGDAMAASLPMQAWGMISGGKRYPL
jgi:hypothetical protein